MSKKINIYTDGAAIGNPGPGGLGIIMEWEGKGYIKEFSQGYRHTTNNRMELLAVINGLENLKKAQLEVTIFSDSKYVVDAIEKKWVWRWEKKNFKEKKNSDLWKRFLKIYPKHKVSLQWVKGHSGHPQNERCDKLAESAARQSKSKLKTDSFYEKESKK